MVVSIQPATVSRCGMIYLEPSSLGWEPVLQSWCNTLPDELNSEHGKLIMALFHWALPVSITFVRKHCKVSASFHIALQWKVTSMSGYVGCTRIVQYLSIIFISFFFVCSFDIKNIGMVSCQTLCLPKNSCKSGYNCTQKILCLNIWSFLRVVFKNFIWTCVVLKVVKIVFVLFE